MLKLSEMRERANLPQIKREITQQKINLYAEASRDFNPIHLDEEFAKTTPAGGTIAHGMLTLAYLSQVMTEGFGKSWVSGGKLSVRFKSPARPNDTLTVSGTIIKVEETAEGTLVACDLVCKNQHDEALITGNAELIINKSELAV